MSSMRFAFLGILTGKEKNGLAAQSPRCEAVAIVFRPDLPGP